MSSTFVEIDENSKVPKYKQVADLIISNISDGRIKIGDRIPSINEISEDLLLSRDTVEKAYKNLQKRGIITSVHGKGYYASSTTKKSGIKILLIFNKLSDHKKAIYNSFIKKLGDTADADLLIHNSDSQVLEKIIIENLGKYDYYVIMPHFRKETISVKDAINKIPKDKLLLINKDLEGIDGNYGCVYEDFEFDIRNSLLNGLERIRKYQKLILIFPVDNYYCSGIKDGFVNFCIQTGFDYEIIDQAHDFNVKPFQLFLVIEEFDLVEIIKKAAAKNLRMGKNIGIIAYNDSPFKEILAGGISVLSTDFDRMGAEIATMIQSKNPQKIKNPFALIFRKSV